MSDSWNQFLRVIDYDNDVFQSTVELWSEECKFNGIIILSTADDDEKSEQRNSIHPNALR